MAEHPRTDNVRTFCIADSKRLIELLRTSYPHRRILAVTDHSRLGAATQVGLEKHRAAAAASPAWPPQQLGTPAT
jgi:hypothetical protein